MKNNNNTHKLDIYFGKKDTISIQIYKTDYFEHDPNPIVFDYAVDHMLELIATLTNSVRKNLEMSDNEEEISMNTNGVENEYQRTNT